MICSSKPNPIIDGFEIDGFEIDGFEGVRGELETATTVGSRDSRQNREYRGRLYGIGLSRRHPADGWWRRTRLIGWDGTDAF